MKLDCQFCEFQSANGDKCYGCWIEDKEIPEGEILEFYGIHGNGKSNDDVIHVQFDKCTVSKVPQGLLKVFPNMKILEILNSTLKNVSKTDLAEYNNLEGFYSIGNQLEFLPGSLFEDFENLEKISFLGNKLQLVEPNILDGLEKLKFVDFCDNPNYDKGYSDYPAHLPNATLQEIRNEFYEKFFKSVPLAYFQEVQKLRALEQIMIQDVEKLSKHSIFDDLKSHIQDESFKNFKIEIDGHEFPVHKFLLAARSPTLAEMLRNNPKAENLKLVDIPVEVFEVILKFLYTDELPRDSETNFLHLFAAASRLKIKKITNYAAMKIVEQVNKINALEILDLSNKFDHNLLRQKAFNEIKKNYPEIDFEDDMANDAEEVAMVIESSKIIDSFVRTYAEEVYKYPF